MALQYGKLADIQYVASSAGSLYANPASTKTYIKSIVLFNGNTTTETVKLYNVPDATAALGTAGVSNIFLQKDLAANETFIIDLEYPIVLTDQNDSLQAVTTTASKVTVQIMGNKDA